MRLEMKPALEQRGYVHGLDGGSREETLVNLPIFFGDNHATICNHSPLEAISRPQARIVRARGGRIAGQTESPIHERFGRHGDGIRVAEEESGSRDDKAGSIRVSYKGAVASRRTRNLIRALAKAHESALRAVQSTGNLGNTPDAPGVVVEDLQH